MNIYQKLNKARVDLQKLNLKKTGKVSFGKTNYTFYELGDFLPAVNTLCLNIGLTTKLITVKDKVILTIFNVDEPTEKIDFTAEIKDIVFDIVSPTNHIKNWGGKMSYLRRYMLFTAFEIAESDFVEAITKNLTEEVDEKDVKLIKESKSIKQLEALYKDLSTKYKMTLLQPLFAEVKEILTQKESKA
jgi:hypothetical protein